VQVSAHHGFVFVSSIGHVTKNASETRVFGQIILFVIFMTSALNMKTAAALNGNKLLEECRGHSEQVMLCIGYVRAIADVMELGPLPIIGTRACILNKSRSGS
jgi:hypothetical protein